MPADKHPHDSPRSQLREHSERLRALEWRPEELPASRIGRPYSYFGALTEALRIRFMAMRTHHHLKIIREIARHMPEAAP